MGVNFEMRPVLPMVMRGVPATREKGMYIFFDTAREGRRQGVPYGNFYDPIGIRCDGLTRFILGRCRKGGALNCCRAFCVMPLFWASALTRIEGCEKVVEAAGLDWQAAKQHLGSSDWETLVEENRLRMYEAGLWGVPSYRLLDPEGKPLLEVWGQDRLWLVVKTIKDHFDGSFIQSLGFGFLGKNLGNSFGSYRCYELRHFWPGVSGNVVTGVRGIDEGTRQC